MKQLLQTKPHNLEPRDNAAPAHKLSRRLRSLALPHCFSLSYTSVFKMRFIIRDDAEQASVYVANYVVDRIKHFNPTPSHPFVLGLPTGSSPLGVYKVLVEKYKAGEVSIPSIDIDTCCNCTRTSRLMKNCGTNRYHLKIS